MKILGYNYTITNDDADEIGGMGAQCARVQRLKLATNQHPEQKISTLLHEIIEALNYHLQLELPHHAIQALEAGLYQTLTDNGVDLTPLLKETLNG